MAKRAAIYCRVSTQDQNDHGYSLPQQAEACQEYCRLHNLEATAVLAEDVSGKARMQERGQGALLVGMIARKEIDAIVAMAVDRYSRDFADMSIYLRDWYNAGIQLHALDAGRARGSTDITWIVQGWKAAEDWKRIRKNTMNGRRNKGRGGKVVGAGRPPYGYSYARDERGKVIGLEIVPAEAEVVKLIFRLYTEGDGNSGPLAACRIAQRLTDLEIPTPGDVRPGYERRVKCAWRPNGIIVMISRETYCGTWGYNAGLVDDATGELLDEREAVSVPVPAIIGRATWEAAQERRAKNKKFAKRNGKHEYLLRGLIRCSCGLAMAGSIYSHSTTRGYKCPWRNTRHTEPRPPHQMWANADTLEASVWGSLVELFRDLTRLESLLRQAQAAEQNALEPQRQEFNTVSAALTAAEQEAASIARAIVAASGAIGQALQQQAEIVNMRYVDLSRRRDELAAALVEPALTDAAIQATLRFAADVYAGMKCANFAEKRAVLERLNVLVTVNEGRFFVESALGSWDGAILRANGRPWAIATRSSPGTRPPGPASSRPARPSRSR